MKEEAKREIEKQEELERFQQKKKTNGEARKQERIRKFI